MKQHVKAAVFNVTESAEDTGFIAILFCHVFLCVVSARKYQQGQNNLFSKGIHRDKFRGLQTFLCRQMDHPLPTLEYLPSITLLSVACSGRSKTFSFGPLPKVPAVVNICNQYRLVVSVLLASLLKIFKSILVAGREMGRGEVGECTPRLALAAPLPTPPYRTFSGRQAAPSTADVTAPHPRPC